MIISCDNELDTQYSSIYTDMKHLTSDLCKIYYEKGYRILRFNEYIIITRYLNYIPSIHRYEELSEYIKIFRKTLVNWSHEDLINLLIEIDNILDGRYIAIKINCNGKNDKASIFRDPLGLASLYSNEKILSDQKKLIYGLIKEDFNRIVFSVPPGIWYNFSKVDNRIWYYKALNDSMWRENPHHIKLTSSLDKVSRLYLDYLLIRLEMIRKKEKIKNVLVAYSGGVDSSLTAKLAIESGLNVEIAIIYSKGSKDEVIYEYAYKAFPDADVKPIVFDQDQLHNDLKSIIYVVENYSPINISVAIPEYYLFAYSGTKHVFMGQGSDELFGGYKKYVDNYEMANELIKKDVIRSYRANFEREDKLSRFFNKVLYYPLISPAITIFALNLPLEYKILSREDHLRKWVVRYASKYLDLPDDIVLREKRSMQYSTGSMKLLRKIAKKMNTSLTNLLYDIYSETVLKLYK